ncbi:MAG: hypothetical protein Q7T16_03620 [Candidatus Burarchaeum sp.]|nr:hypothetical protein [Candidatus Burarchaeum sp.]MDO8339720.1 hypothetical protein [Candidatus Burarchaeum sp.]
MVEVNEKTILMLVLAVLVLASLLQAFQLNSMSAAVAQQRASGGAVQQSSGAVAQQSSGGSSLPAGLANLPTQVGGC